jgi:hypothetical protein
MAVGLSSGRAGLAAESGRREVARLMITNNARTTLVRFLALIACASTGCGGHSARQQGAATNPTRGDATSAAPESTAALIGRLHDAWTAPKATVAPSDGGPSAVSPRMSVAERVASVQLPRPVTDQRTALSLLGLPGHRSKSGVRGSTWSVVDHHRTPPTCVPGTSRSASTPTGRSRRWCSTKAKNAYPRTRRSTAVRPAVRR